METTIWQKPKKNGGFKSYYVVWKLRIEYIEPFLTRKFKSYYVVWKLFYSV